MTSRIFFWNKIIIGINVIESDKSIENQLSSQMQLSSGINWNNTVEWVYPSDYRDLYFIPAGFGINITMGDNIPEQGVGYIVYSSSNTAINNMLNCNKVIFKII